MSSEQVPRGISITAITFVVDSACFVVSVVVAVLTGLGLIFLFDKPSSDLTEEDVSSAGGFNK
jgi:hypothetical protein